MNIDLKALGITEEDLIARIVDSTVDRMLDSIGYDEDGNEFVDNSRMATRLTEIVQKMIDAKVQALADTHVKPLIESRLESLVLQQTNKWGEKTGQPVTFIEYLTQRADVYMAEPVDVNGKQYSTRVAHMMEKYLATSIRIAMEQALKDANASISKGLAEAVKIALADAQAKLKVDVRT
jgi:hypothetical protein